ncbi:Protein NIF3-like protein [Diplonema papillatum]|nr:Protein NIF3-like protein [Diplonema papillatum]
MATIDFDHVVKAMGHIAPLKLADTTWDNVGIMVETPALKPSKKVLLTIDFTEAVLTEAIEHDASIIVAYHPPIFRPFKCLKLADHKAMLLLTALANNMSIYCPHSALDSVEDGINDWIVKGLGGKPGVPIQPTDDNPREGVGRIAEVNVAVSELVKRAKKFMEIDDVRVALPYGKTMDSMVHSVSVCAGSGGSVVRLAKKADAYFTGEMSHHEVLAATAEGITVILSEHTRTERGYLSAKLKPKLESQLPPDFTILVSEMDGCPLRTC